MNIPPHPNSSNAPAGHTKTDSTQMVRKTPLNFRAAEVPFNFSAPGKLMGSNMGRAMVNAFRAAYLPVDETILPRLLQAAQGALQRQPGLSIPRLTRLLLELDFRGQFPGPDRIDALLRSDGFGVVAEKDSTANDGGQGGSNSQNPENPQNPEKREFSPQEQPVSDSDAAEEIFEALSLPVVDKKGHEKSPSWQWLSLGSQGWCNGGSLRWTNGKKGMVVNVDVIVAEGMWQFHWAEPVRKRIIVAAPAGNSLVMDEEQWLHILRDLIGPLGFRDFHALASDDWFDGFNFLPAESILRMVDMVV